VATTSDEPGTPPAGPFPSGHGDLSQWTPVAERTIDTVAPGPAAALHALLDAPGPPPGAGDALPALWHWLYFLPAVAQRELGPDGHPRRGGFLPPGALPRRMFVGGRVRTSTPLTIGDRIAREGTVTGVTDKSGRSGPLVFVTVHYRLAEAIDEHQDLVYRAAAQPSAGPLAPPEPTPLDEGAWTLRLDLAVDPVLLFRFSALTYNAHRIHYDRRFATDVEGYPGLVVHGPLQAIALAELCRRSQPQPLRTFDFRALRPAFDEGPLRVRGRVADDAASTDLAAFDVYGSATMTARASW